MNTLIGKNVFWLKWACGFFLLVSLFLAKIDESACFAFVAVFWAIGSLLLVDRLIEKDKFILKFFALVFFLVFCFPMVLHLVLVNSEGILSFFNSKAVDQSAYTFQRNCGELIKIKGCVLSMIEERDVRQMNDRFVWHLFIPGFVCFFFALRFCFLDVPKALWIKFQQKKQSCN